MSRSRILMITLGLAVAAGTSIGCSRNSDRDTTPTSSMAPATDTAAMNTDVGNPTDTSGSMNDNQTAPASELPPRCDDPTYGSTINGQTQTGDPACDDTPEPSVPPPPADPSDR
jgi:hypothetical protein